MSVMMSPGSMSAAARTTRRTGLGMTVRPPAAWRAAHFWQRCTASLTPLVDFQSISRWLCSRVTRPLRVIVVNVSRETSAPTVLYRRTVAAQGRVRHGRREQSANLGRPRRSARRALRGAVGAPPTSVRSVLGGSDLNLKCAVWSVDALDSAPVDVLGRRTSRTQNPSSQRELHFSAHR